MTLKETYQKRSIKHLELWEDNGWRIKLYGITHESRQSEPELIEAAKAAAQEHLPQPAVNPHRYGLGFIGIHQGRSYDFVEHPSRTCRRTRTFQRCLGFTCSSLRT